MRNLGLDLLRIIAVLLVIGRHFELPSDSNMFLQIWQRGGWIGVDLFFVLSGFLVSGLLFREHRRTGTVDSKRFLIRRGFKIYPAFWLFLFVTLAVKSILGESPTTQQLLGELLFLQNYLGGAWDHTWSLAVEEHFYLGLVLLVPCLVDARPDRPFSLIPRVFAISAVVCLLLRITNLFMFPEFADRAYLFATHVRIDSLMYGVFLAYLCLYHDLQSRLARVPSSVLVGLGAFCLSPAFIFPVEQYRWISVFGVALFYLGAGFLVLAAIRLKTSESSVLKMLGALGAASYSIYLWHLAVAEWGHQVVVQAIGVDSFSLYLFDAVVGACLFGWFLNRCIENPVLMIRDRVFPSKTQESSQEVRSVEDGRQVGLQAST